MSNGPLPWDSHDPLEVALVYSVRGCRACSYFWPDPPAPQPYGPYPAFDLSANTPDAAEPEPAQASFVWLTGTTRPPSFPDPEVIDGCRKAPIMTIGINPNLTAFAPGPTGASWCCPSFSSDHGTDAWTKYAWYYRYRSVYQERFDLEFIKRFFGAAGGASIETLSRTEGSCRFCVNDRWQFPLGCPYGNNRVEPPAPGFLEQVAAAIIAAGKNAPQRAPRLVDE